MSAFLIGAQHKEVCWYSAWFDVLRPLTGLLWRLERSVPGWMVRPQPFKVSGRQIKDLLLMFLLVGHWLKVSEEK